MMIMRLLFTSLFIIGHGLCLADGLPGNQKKTGKLTVQQAAELVAKANASNGKQSQLDLKWLTSIDRVYSNSNAFAAIKSDGSVVAWGDNSNGGDVGIESASLNGSIRVNHV